MMSFRDTCSYDVDDVIGRRTDLDLKISVALVCTVCLGPKKRQKSLLVRSDNRSVLLVFILLNFNKRLRQQAKSNL